MSGPLSSTPSQTVGPYLSLGLTWDDGPTVVGDSPNAVWIRGRIADGAQEPIPDALVETWQADQHGRFNHPDDPRGAQSDIRGFGRCPTDANGEYAIRTLPPGPLPDQAPHINVSVFARGLLHRVVTRIYFPENIEANANDPVLNAVPAERRHTLVATRTGDGYRFDVRLQGPEETVFFDV